MVRLTRLVQGLAALAVLAVLVVGVPWALWHFVGWPLPHHVPTAAQVGRALDHQGIPAQTLVDALAVVVWLTWAALVASLAVEIPAALAGRRAYHLPIAGGFQPLTGRLVAAVVVACLALAPRPAHPGAPGTLGRAGLLTHRPVAALVVRGATLTGATTPIPTTPVSAIGPASDGVAAPGATTLAAAAPTPVTYTVQRGDTLWGIAERELGDPLRWSQIYAMNEGRPQPGGATLTDPHWIDPGWTLLLPAPPESAAATPAGPEPSAPPATAPGTPSASPSPTSVPPPPAASAPSPSNPPVAAPMTHTPSSAGAPPANHHGGVQNAAASGAEPVRLPSGSVVAASFAAGALSAVALGRLRRRRTYRYRPPEPGRNLRPDPLRPTLRHLTTAAANGQPPSTPDEVPAMADDDPEHRERPDLIDVGAREGHPVELALSTLGGVAITGPGSAEVVAAWVTAVMVRAGPRAAQVLMTSQAGVAVFGADVRFDAVPGLRVFDRPQQVLAVLEREMLSRSRQLAEDETPDVVSYRRANPWEPVPTILAVVDHVPAGETGRWEAVGEAGPRLGLAVLTCDPDALMPVQLTVDEHRVVIEAAPDGPAAELVGVELFGLTTVEAADVLATLAEVEERPDSETGDNTGDLGQEPWPVTAPLSMPTSGSDGNRSLAAARTDGNHHESPVAKGPFPVTVKVFGPYEIAVDGQVVSRGLRSVAKELLAWLSLRPEGASVEAAVDALWPDTGRDQVHRVFWQAAANLRTRLGTGSDVESKVLVSSGDVYRLDPGAVDCDLWRFQQALVDAARADEDRTARDALRRAVDAYRGDLLLGADYPWVEPVRQDLHRRALDAHLRLAELDARLGALDAADDALRRAVNLDRYAEEPYRRLMMLEADRGRPDVVTDTWRLLRSCLDEIDVDPEPATERLYRSLTAPLAGAAARARSERSSW